jgi:tetratricopeptide (TPR) repeat protein
MNKTISIMFAIIAVLILAGVIGINFYGQNMSYLELGNNYARQQQYEEAIKNYDLALVEDPNDIAALLNKGAALKDLGRYDEAIEQFDKALEIDPNNAIALHNKGAALTYFPSFPRTSVHIPYETKG